jgi:hypothetical protein
LHDFEEVVVPFCTYDVSTWFDGPEPSASQYRRILLVIRDLQFPEDIAFLFDAKALGFQGRYFLVEMVDLFVDVVDSTGLFVNEIDCRQL